MVAWSFSVSPTQGFRVPFKEITCPLNYGDCFSHALAKEMNLPLLFKGNDFARTDILAATDAAP
ncbi:MAG: hypothetical protein CMM23_13105 [Rhodospirillaceae bacterium]|nr:hypothetical protein [Rhodospirillaceae bacterium]